MTHVIVTPPISAAVGGAQFLRGLCEGVAESVNCGDSACML